LGNVTDDAQLNRSASDFSTFTEKTVPVSSDLLLIEDSAVSGAKKRVQVGNLSGGGSEPTRVFQVHEYTGGQVIPGYPPDPITFNDTPTPVHAPTFSWNGSSELTIMRAGNVVVIAAVTVVWTSGSGRENMVARIERKTGGGSWVSLWGSDAWVYIRSSNGGKHGTALSRTAFVAAANDKIRVTAYRDNEVLSLATVEDACNLVVQWSPI